MENNKKMEKEKMKLFSKIRYTNSVNEKKRMLEDIDELEEYIIRKTYEKKKYNISYTKLYGILQEYNSKEKSADIIEFFENNIYNNLNCDYDYADVNIADNFYKNCECYSGNFLIDYLKVILKTEISFKYLDWLFQSLCSDMRIGLNIKSINEVFIKLNKKPIVNFVPQLANGIKDLNKVEGNITDYVIEEKIDGIRLLTKIKKVNKTLEFTLTTRQGTNKSSTFKKFFTQINLDIDSFPELLILDGELMSDTFNNVLKEINRKTPDVSHLKYIVYDILQYNDENFINNKEFIERRQFLENIVFKKFIGFSSKIVLSQKMKDDNSNDKELYLSDIKLFFDEIIKKKGEGIMLKHNKSKYCEIGSNNVIRIRKGWYKYKPELDVDVKIIGAKYGTGKYKDKISILEVENDDYRFFVGSGLSNAIREQFTKEYENNTLLGKIVEIKFTEVGLIHDNKKSVKNPRFFREREDKQ